MDTNYERKTKRAYLAEFLPAVVGYVAVLGAIILLVDFERAGAWRFAVALLPVGPALWGAVAVARHLRRIDELQRQVHLSGMATGFGVAMITALTLGFLAMAGLDGGRVGPWLVYSAGMLAWMTGSALAAQRVA